MAVDFRMIRWRFIGLAALAALYLSLPWLSDRIGRDDSLPLLLVVPFAAACAGALALMFYQRAEDSRPLLHAEQPAIVAIALPRWSPLFFMAQGALLTVALDGSLGEAGGRLALLGFLAANIWFGMYRQSQRQQSA
jgi:hypothetical protein